MGDGEKGRGQVKEFDCFKMLKEQEDLYSSLLASGT